MIKVVKFGGSSLADAAQFQKAGQIIRKEEERRYVVPSAPGKRSPDDTKVTDMLYGCYGAALTDEEDFSEEKLQEAGIRIRFENRDLASCLSEIEGFISRDKEKSKRGDQSEVL